ncbi:transcriptional repressor [Stutzerimonas kirkiae]|uniref:Transcriptional repressor n=1 Tax=Stutzerimonas kirkiae TaxID=2211392 RepID=A0A4Q9RAM5_9GAMM|nr:transcriptional repressor [Stutzerimonas kirkiae]TBU97772.1 transcriptional repressor [Stutzerimonas kirkiae]TBV04877.1 transcriptional repressor [Stutzerimonas kirkiae]TBV12013.1 transcriptional repressor [Stutzerimonas kirkiae]TBV14978.1 transcriptional repressor [Stutzerimonas kirkiae]
MIFQNTPNHALRQLLNEAGLKVSLPRLKVLALFRDHALASDGLSCKELHSLLVETGTPVSLLCVRQMLPRLCNSNLLTCDNDKTYRLNSEVLAEVADQPQPERRLVANA